MATKPKFKVGEKALWQSHPQGEPLEVTVTRIFPFRGYGGRTYYDYGVGIARAAELSLTKITD